MPYQPAIITEKYYYSDGYEEEIYSFDVENHSLYIRCRYYMEWEPLVEYEEGWGPGEKQSKYSGWSESAVFGKNSTQIIPDEPTTYEAPIISDMKIVLSEGDENSHIEYTQTTPESVWTSVNSRPKVVRTLESIPSCRSSRTFSAILPGCCALTSSIRS